MRYVLLLGVSYKKFKGNCRLTVATGQRVIDDVIINDSIDEINPKNFESMIPIIPDDPVRFEKIGKKVQNSKKFPTKIFKYEVEGNEMGDHVVIDLKLNDNNYTNAFMTKTALIKIKFVYLFPKVATVYQKYYSMFHDWCVDLEKKKGRWQTIDWKKTISYPGPHRVSVTDKNTGDETIYIGQEDLSLFYEQTFGGNHTIKIALLRKGRSLKFGSADYDIQKPLPGLIDVLHAYRLINTTNENQRSHL